MKKIILIITIILSINTYGQKNLYAYFDTETGQVAQFYIHNKSGIFILSATATLETVILGYFKSSEVLDVISDFDHDRIRKVFTIANIKIATYSLSEINYPEKNSYVSDLVKDLPTSINGFSFEYFANYDDDDSVKGKIKSIGGITINYFKDYYLPDEIKEKIAAIGCVKITLLNDYVHPETKGKVSKIGDIPIKYYFSYLHENINGKVTSIGGYKFTYFDDIYDKRHFGQFKKMSGSDHRFGLLQ